MTEGNVVDIFPVAHENQVLAIDQLQLKITHEVSQLELCQHSVKLEAVSSDDDVKKYCFME